MPLVVDHDARRDHIARVVRQIIATEGMDAVTIRHVARQAGFKSTVISHYFRDKREMLIYTLQCIRNAAAQRVALEFQSSADLASCLDSLLCIDAERILDWRVWFGFWGKATFDPDLAELRARIVAQTHDYLQQLLQSAIAANALPAATDAELQAQRLQSIFNGIAAMFEIDPTTWTPQRQRSVLAEELQSMTGTAASRRSAPTDPQPCSLPGSPSSAIK